MNSPAPQSRSLASKVGEERLLDLVQGKNRSQPKALGGSCETCSAFRRLQDLAGVTMRLVDALVKKSDSQLTDSAAVLEKILVAAADENGQWQVPLSDAKVEAMRKVRLQCEVSHHGGHHQAGCV